MQRNADVPRMAVENIVRFFLSPSTTPLRRRLTVSFPKRQSAARRSADGRLEIGERVASCRLAERLSSWLRGRFVPEERPN